VSNATNPAASFPVLDILVPGDAIVVNGKAFTVARSGGGIVQMRGKRGGEHVLVCGLNTGVWSHLDPAGRERAVASVEAVSL
jgi:hypothetical protein